MLKQYTFCINPSLKKCVTLSVIYILIVSLFVLPFCSFSQNANSQIWGNTNTAASMGEPLYNQGLWGVLPSEQTRNSMSSDLSRNNLNGNTRRRYRNDLGNLLMTDAQGNLLYDAQGNTMVDSVAMNQTLMPDAVLPPPPVDPVDVPIDGGVEILLIIGLGIGYTNKNMGKTKPKIIKAIN